MGINEWKNRFDKHILHHLSKMIQQHMFKPKQNITPNLLCDETV